MALQKRGTLLLVLLVSWIVAAAAIFLALRGGDDTRLSDLAIAVAVPPAALLLLFGFFALWWLLFDELPRRFRRWRRGPPWQTPRPVHPFGDRRERADHAALRARLTRIESTGQTGEALYLDAATSQKWWGEYIEQGFGSGEILRPVDDD